MGAWGSRSWARRGRWVGFPRFRHAPARERLVGTGWVSRGFAAFPLVGASWAVGFPRLRRVPARGRLVSALMAYTT
eukprot:4092066-Pyramimonas_sp.AAC.1